MSERCTGRRSLPGRLRTSKWQALTFADASYGILCGCGDWSRASARWWIDFAPRMAPKPGAGQSCSPFAALFFSHPVRPFLAGCRPAHVCQFARCAHQSAEGYGRASRDDRASAQSERAVARVPVHASEEEHEFEPASNRAIVRILGANCASTHATGIVPGAPKLRRESRARGLGGQYCVATR